jgi:AcrR family transcriptional regulator
MCAARAEAPQGRGASRTRERLLEAARLEFSEKGIECATTRAIAERAGCNEVTLFRHFESKGKLLAAVVEETSEEFRALCESREAMTGDLCGDLRRFGAAYQNSLERCEGMARALIGEGRRHPTLVRELIGDVLKPFHDSISQYLAEQVSRGRVRPDVDRDAFAEVFTATLTGGLLRRTSGLSRLTGEGWLRETVEFLARGIEPRGNTG